MAAREIPIFATEDLAEKLSAFLKYSDLCIRFVDLFAGVLRDTYKTLRESWYSFLEYSGRWMRFKG